jgi:hypothetical protein
MAQLRELNLGGARVTGEGVKKLQQALPNCKIEGDPTERRQPSRSPPLQL